MTSLSRGPHHRIAVVALVGLAASGALVAIGAAPVAEREAAGRKPAAPAAREPQFATHAALVDRWATKVHKFDPGPQDIRKPDGPKANFGKPENALGPASTSDVGEAAVCSLGDGGSITLEFDPPISDIGGVDFAVFENSNLLRTDGKAFLELAFVEVSSDGTRFVRFPAESETPTTAQVGGFDSLDPRLVRNLAGAFPLGFGTPFDLADLPDDPRVKKDAIRFVRIVDVVGSVDAKFGKRDEKGRLVNDPFPTDANNGGFDVDAVGVLKEYKADADEPKEPEKQ